MDVGRLVVSHSDADTDSLYKELDDVISHGRTRPRFKPDTVQAVSKHKVPIELVQNNNTQSPLVVGDQGNRGVHTRQRSEAVRSENSDSSPIWCLDCQSNLIVVGCASGVLEVWEATTGKLKVRFATRLTNH